ncbi:MAG: nicotinate (nicotinamide) nucleotide adenylyltransferase [Clostridia bacterium]|nr:nicotinate (nicotinamide) nucleotide adenylyltransferase [Clostridia bacterium]
MKNNIGIFGGSFDPMHSGHIKLAKFLVKELELSKLIIVPAAMSPFKNVSHSADKDRLEMCRLSLPEACFEISDFEISRGGVSYSVDTVSHFREAYPQDELYLIIGEDQLLIFDKWFRWKDILKTVTLAAVKRNDETSLSSLEEFADKNLRAFGRVVLLPFEPLEVSSTEIRGKIKNGESVAGLVSPETEDYIIKNGLYKNEMNELDSIILADVRERLSDFRYNHSLCVAEAARKLALRFGGDEKKAYTAGIAHDILKELPAEEAEKLFEEAGAVLTPLEKHSKKLWHAMAGEIYLRKHYPLPEDILSAVRWHTTGKENMTLLEKIIFVADFISDDRDYNGVEEMRERAKTSLELAMEEGLRFTIEDLSRECRPIHPDTLSAYNQIILERK